jgi:hypothetical protein
MPRITTQKEFAQHKQLGFCYLCGEPLDNGYLLDDDHCPPKSIFNVTDRSDYPIKLKVHKQCNHAWHSGDDLLSLFFDPLSEQGKAANEKHRNRMEKHKVSVDLQDHTLVGYTNLPLRPFAARVVRCMHALLYKESFPEGVQGHIMYPFGEANQRGQLISTEMSAISLSMSRRIASSLKAATFDCVIAYNGKFKYVCCWSIYDSGKPICLYAFDVLNMAQMAYPMAGLPKTVVGHYVMNPPHSDYSKATDLEIPLSVDEVEYPLPK